MLSKELLIEYFVDGTELTHEQYNYLLFNFLIKRDLGGYVLTEQGKFLLKIIRKKDEF